VQQAKPASMIVATLSERTRDFGQLPKSRASSTGQCNTI